jgi:hypothetical protein
MQKLLLAGACLAALACVAHAADRAPVSEKVLGTWCSVDNKDVANPNVTAALYRREENPAKGRAPCKGEDWMTIKQDGYDGGEFSCKTVSSKPFTDVKLIGLEEVNYRCSGEGSAWNERCVITLIYHNKWRDHNTLAVVCQKMKGK